MRFRSHPRRDEPEINLIPLIDVLLVILIFLMITTTYSRYTGLRIQLPRAEAEPASDRPQQIVVSVSARGTYAVNRQVIEAGGQGDQGEVQVLTERLRRVAAGLAQPPVVIVNADAQASHQAVINVMEAARQAGLSRLTFATQTAQRR